MADMNLKPYVGLDYSMIQKYNDFKDVAKSNLNAVCTKFNAETFYLNNGVKDDSDYNATSYVMV